MKAKLIVSFIRLEHKTMAQYINPLSGKIHYIDASLVVKQVAANTRSFYKVSVKNGKCLKVIHQINRRIKRKEIKRTMKQMSKIEI